MDATETDDEALVGDACHIVGDSVNGPRGNSPLSAEQRDRYANLILLCKVHHKQVDDQRNTYTEELLKQIKEDHEHWVAESLEGFDKAKQRDFEVYAAYVDEWQKRADLDGWSEWASSLMSHGQPSLSAETDEQLEDLRKWLFNRIWPKRLLELESAFENFRRVLGDLQEKFREYADNHSGRLWTRKFYQINRWDPELYERLSNQFDFHVDLVEDLTLELSRAGNYVCDRIRQTLDPNFRMEQGALVVESGPGTDFRHHTYRPEYVGGERVLMPYPGLQEFQEARFARDVCFGKSSD
jgi:hypothetical protein